MKKIAGLLIISFFQFYAYGQFKDVVVLNKGDSIACKIINISEEKIYYKMLSNDNIIDTYSKKDDVKAYYRNHTLFEYNKRTKGSSRLTENNKSNIASFSRKNVVGIYFLYFYPGIYYERRIPVSKKSAIGISLGAFSVFGDRFLDLGLKVLTGGPKHYFDINFSLLKPLSDDQSAILGGVSYQYISQKGFLFKIGGGVLMGWPFLKLGIGYNF